MASDPYRYFRIEARELVDGLGQGILALEKGSPDAAVVPRLLRFAHTLKGAARVVKQLEIAELSHQVEEILAGARDAGRNIDAAEARALLALVDRMSAGVQALSADPSAATAPAAKATPAAPVAVRAVNEDAFQTVRIELEEMDGLLRAVTETGVQLAALEREVEAVRQLHGLSAALATRLALRAGTGRNAAEVKELGLATDLQAGLERAVLALAGSAERVDQELGDVRDGADRLRLVPVQTLLAPLSRAARDAAESLGKNVDFALAGGALRLDAHVLGPLRDALQHLVRNAVAHGIETPGERHAAGKVASGSVRLTVERRAERVHFTCHDDGRGIDEAAVRRELVARGALSAAESEKLPQAALLERLLSAGLTTTREVTQISGRGIGLDVVRETAARLQGEVAVRTEAGRGTSIEISVPVSLAALRALVVDAGGVTVAIPLEAVSETVRLTSADFQRSARGDAVARGGQVIPFLPLARALKRPLPSASRAAWSAVVVGSGGRAAALGVDRLRGAFEVVVRPMPAGVNADPVVAGASLDAEGNPQLVLDALGLVAAAGADQQLGLETLAERPPILVIDDSLTTRMLEQSILESAGYDVELAVSAEQGLEKARQKRYGLFIVDVEMPGMDGFEFVTRTRADSELGQVPAILVTSRNDPADLERGRQAGASAYIIKGEFDQNQLLASIRGLLG